MLVQPDPCLLLLLSLLLLLLLLLLLPLLLLWLLVMLLLVTAAAATDAAAGMLCIPVFLQQWLTFAILQAVQMQACLPPKSRLHRRV